MTHDQDREAREALRLAAAAAVEERIRLAVESAPSLPPDVERRIPQLIAYGATIDTATARTMVNPSRLAEFDRHVAEAEPEGRHA